MVKSLLGAAQDAGVLSELLMLRDHRGDTCLSIASRIGRKDIAQALVTAGAEYLTASGLLSEPSQPSGAG
jgi:ankyrin repeat protein